MKKVALNWKRLGTNTLYGAALAAPVAYLGSKGLDALEIAQGDKPPEIRGGILPWGTTRDYRHHVGRGYGVDTFISDAQRKREKKRYERYFDQLRQAPNLSPGDKVVTASALPFLEKRAALQETDHTKEAFLGALKRLVSSGARATHRAEKATQAATLATENAAARGKQIKDLVGSSGVSESAAARILEQMGTNTAAAGGARDGIFSKMLSNKGILIGSGLLGLGALADPVLERYGYKWRESVWPTKDGLGGLPERVRMDELAAESFANSVGKELGKSTVGLVGDILSKGISLPGSIMEGQQRKSVFDTLRQEDDVIARSDPEQLNEAYHTMVRFAPTLATDKNAVKTFLRESVLYGTGPNFMAIKQLADAEKAVNPMALVKVSR